MCLYVLVGRVAPQTRMLFRRTLYQNVPVLILLKISDMGPYGIHLTKWHLISRHHGEIYTTRSVQSRPPQFQQPQDRTEQVVVVVVVNVVNVVNAVNVVNVINVVNDVNVVTVVDVVNVVTVVTVVNVVNVVNVVV